MASTNYHYLPEETQQELKFISDSLLTNGKGILSADECPATIGRRFKSIELENNEENRNNYRHLLFSTDNLEEFITGVILHNETIFQKYEDDGTMLIDVLRQKKIIPGIKVDRGVVPLYGSINECTTQGLDDLGPRCQQYKKVGCHFAKFRNVFRIGQLTPSEMAVHDNTYVLARFASVCQAYRMVPIVEAEVLPDGNHNILYCQKVTEKILSELFKSLNDYNIFLEGMILKTNMVTPGYSCKISASPEEIAEATITTLRRSVPASVSGILFLSGGQSEEQTTRNLNAIANTEILKPWPLSFNFGRALQASALITWGGIADNKSSAQEELLRRCKANAEACLGKYEAIDSDKENVLNQNLFIESYEY